MLAQLASERRHVLRTVDGLENDQMRRALIPSGWTMTQLLNHLAFDDEMFWISAVLGGDDRAIAGLHNGWASGPMTGAEAVTIYKREITRSDEVLAKIDLDAPPRWWPPASVFDAPPMSNGLQIKQKVRSYCQPPSVIQPPDCICSSHATKDQSDRDYPE